MVRETRHLWVGNLPDNIREDRIREHFKRYGRVQNVKLLGRTESATASAPVAGNSGVCATVAFMDIKSASKAHNAEHIVEERTLTTEYYEPAAIPSAAGAPSAGSSPAGSGYSGSSSSVNSAPAPASVSRYHLSGGEEGNSTCAIAATAAAPANWRGTNDSATEYCRRGNTPAAYGRYQRNNSTPYATPPSSNVESRGTPHHRWYASGERSESTPSTPGGGTDGGGGGGRRRRRSGSGSSRSDSSSAEPSDGSRASSPAAPAPHPPHPPHPPHTPAPLSAEPAAHHQWASTASGRPLAICVRNLPTRSTDSSLKDGLYHEYKKHGKVVWVKVVGQNADRYAVVRFKKPSDVEKALEVSQDKLFFGCKISVAPHQSCDEDADSAKPYETDIDEYHPKATRTLFIGNLEKDVTQQQLRDKFKHYGRIIEIDIKKGSGGGAGYAFCQYAAISSVVEAIRAMDGEYVGGSRVKLGFGKPVATTCVWVDGLTEHTEKQVLSAVSRCGAATSVCVDRAAGAALVHFEQAAAAGGAVRELRRVAAQVSSSEPERPRLAVDYASRECQEAFYEQLEKHGGSAALTSSERLTGDLTPRYAPSPRHDQLRYETSTSRSRASSYGRSSSRTPRYTTVEHYDPAEYAADRRYRVYEELASSPQADEISYEDRLQSVVVSPHRARKHRRDSSPEDRKHSKERHRNACAIAGARRSRSGSRSGVGVSVSLSVSVSGSGERHLARRRHRRRREGSGSRGSRAGTPLRDEWHDAAAAAAAAVPCEPRRPPRERPPLPMSLPLPKFAAQLLRAAAPAPRAAPPPAPAPDSPPRPRSASSSSAGSAPHSPSLEERIRSLDEKYEKWNGSRSIPEAPDRTRLRHRLLEVDINEVKPSEVVLSLLAKRSVFDEDSERLEGSVRAPSPADGVRGRGPGPSGAGPAAARALRYPFPAHPLPQTPTTPLTPCTPLTPPSFSGHSTPLQQSQDTELEVSERPADPRLNRAERPYQMERLGKFNESDYKLEGRFRLRTPSIDKPIELNERRQSPKAERERSEPERDPRKDVERRRRDSLYAMREAENKSALDAEEKEVKEAIEKIDPDFKSKERTPPFPANYTISTNESPAPSLLLKDSCENHLTNRPTETVTIHKNVPEQTSGPSLELKDDRASSGCEMSDKKSDSVDTDLIQSLDIVGSLLENKLETIETQSHKHDSDKSKDILIQNHNNKDVNDLEIHKSNVHSVKLSKDVSESNQEFVKSQDKNGKERYNQSIIDIYHSAKREKENIEFEQPTEKGSLHEKKSVEQEKHVEERPKLERENSKQSKERLDKNNKHDEKKDSKINKNERTSDAIKPDKRPREDTSHDKPHPEKGRLERDMEKIHKDKSDREKHGEEKVSRHEHHKKDKIDKDKRKDSTDSDISKQKKDDRHKKDNERRKDNECKRDKKEEISKSRKSSRDESSRDLCRKDSTDSTTSRASHESAKAKEPEHLEIKEESKPKLKSFDIFSKQEPCKEFIKASECVKYECNNQIKLEIKEEKLANETYYKQKMDSLEDLFKCKPENIDKHRHYSVDSLNLDCKRKERLNSSSSLPSHIGHKRRLSSQEGIDLFNEDVKKSRNEPRLPERRDSKDSRTEKHKTAKFNKGHFAKLIESKTKEDKKNQVKPPDDSLLIDGKELEKDSKKPLKKCSKVDLEEKGNQSSNLPQPGGLQNDLAFLATLELRSSEEDERQKALRKEMKEKKRIQQLQQIQELQKQQDALNHAELLGKLKDDKKQKTDDKKKEVAREKRMSTDRKSRDDKIECSKKKIQSRQSSTTKLPSSDTSDSDEPKKHSIFDIVDDGPTYISMYDKVKARSCKNMQKQEEEKRQEKIKAKFSQLKQSRAKREEKKRSSWDEDSDSEQDSRKPQKVSMDSSSDDEQIAMENRKRDKLHNLDFERNKSHDYFSMPSTEEDIRNKISRKNSRSRIISDTSDDDNSKRSISKSPSFLNDMRKEFMDILDLTRIKENNTTHKDSSDKIKKNSLLNLFGKSDSDDSKMKSSLDSNDSKIFGKSMSNDISSECESISSNRNVGEFRKKHKKKQKRHKFGFSDDENKIKVNDTSTIDGDLKYKSLDKIRRHSMKKERRRDKIRDSFDGDENREDKTKIKKEKKPINSFELGSDISPNVIKKDGKMEDIFGPLSDESDRDIKTCKVENTQDYDSSYNIAGERATTIATNETKVKEREDAKRRKERKRKDKKLFIKEDENSLDVDAVSKAIEERLFADTVTDDDSRNKLESLATNQIKRQDSSPNFEENLIETVKLNDKYNEKVKRENKERKKKKKKSKEERHSRKEHHQFNHNDKDLSSNAMLLDIPLPNDTKRPYTNDKHERISLSESPSLPKLTDSPPHLCEIKNIDSDSPTQLSGDLEIDFDDARQIAVNEIPMPPQQQFDNIVTNISEVPLPSDPLPPKQESKQDLFLQSFRRDNVSEDAVRSISELNKDDRPSQDKTDSQGTKLDKKIDEKPRAVISQKETADAVAALLGESFGGKDVMLCYEEVETSSTNQIEIETTTLENENIPEEDAEEMRQAVQNLNASEMEIKPDTPASDNDLLLIDTDTEEADETPQDALERLPVNIIATNQNVSSNTADSSKSTDVNNIIAPPVQKSIPIPPPVSKDTNKKISEADATLLLKLDNAQKVTSSATPVIKSWTLANNKLIEPHLLNIQPNQIAARESGDNKNTTNITTNIVKIKCPQNQTISTSLRPILTPNRVTTPYQVINRPQVPNMQPPIIKIPEQHVIYQKPQGILISPRMANDVRLQSPKSSPQGEPMTSPRLTNISAVINTSTQNINAVSIPSPNAVQQRSPGQLTLVRTPIQTVHLSHGARAMVSPNRPGSVLVQAPIHFNRFPVTPVLAPISKQMNVTNIVQTNKTAGINTSPIMQQKVITGDNRKVDQRAENINEGSKIILSPTSLQHSTNPTVMAQNRLISMQNALHSGNIHLPNKVLLNNINNLNDKRDQIQKSEQLNHVPYGSGPILVTGINNPTSSIIQSGPKPTVCNPQEGNNINRGLGSNVIHSVGSQRLLTTAPISNMLPMDITRTQPSVLSMATIRSPNIVTKLDSSNSTVVSTTSLTNVIMTPLIIKPSPAVNINTVRLNNKSDNDYTDSAPNIINNHQHRSDVKLDINNESAKIVPEKLDNKQKDGAGKSIQTSLINHIAKCETDFEELLKDTTNEIKVTNDPDKKLEVNVGKTTTLFSASSLPQERKICVSEPTKDEIKIPVPKVFVSEQPKPSMKVEINTHLKPTDFEDLKVIKATDTFNTVKSEAQELCKDVKVLDGITKITKDEKTESDIKINSSNSSSFSGELINTDNNLKSLDENEPWSAKDVNIESVIKTVDSLCNDNSDPDKKDIETLKNDTTSTDQPTEFNSENTTSESDSNKSTDAAHTEGENLTEIGQMDSQFEKQVISKRGGRSVRGKKSDKTQDRVQTRQISKPGRGVTSAKRGRGRARVDKKLKTLANHVPNLPGDVYDFHEDSGDETATSCNKSESRPRLILTIKSPLSGQTTAIATSSLSINPKEQQKSTEKAVTKEDQRSEDFVSPSPNTRKSRRLQEKDVQRNTVDDVIEDVVKGSSAQIKVGKDTNKKRQTRQAGTKVNQVDKATGADTRKSPRGVKRTRDRSLSDASIDSSDEKITKPEISKDVKVPKLTEPPTAPKVEPDPPQPAKTLPATVNVQPVTTSTPIMKPPKKMISEISAKLAFEAAASAASAAPLRPQPPAAPAVPVAPAEPDKQPAPPRELGVAATTSDLLAVATGDTRVNISSCGAMGGGGGEAALARHLDGGGVPVGASEASDARVQSPALPHRPPSAHRPPERATPLLIRGSEGEGANMCAADAGMAGMVGMAGMAGASAGMRAVRGYAGTASLPRGAHHPPQPPPPLPVHAAHVAHAAHVPHAKLTSAASPHHQHIGPGSRVTITSVPTVSPQGQMALGDGMYPPHFSHQNYQMYQQHFRATQQESRASPSPYTRPLEAEGCEAPTPPLELRRQPSARVPRPAHSPSVPDSRILYGAGCGRSPPPAHGTSRLPGALPPSAAPGPPHASQVPREADSLQMLLRRYPVMWQGLLALKNDAAAVQMHFVGGNPAVAADTLPRHTDGSTPPLRIAQRMRLEPVQLDQVHRKMKLENEHCILLALPCGRDHMDVLLQSTNLSAGFITYLQRKQAAGIVNVAPPGHHQAMYTVHIFPSCDFANENLNRIAPDLMHRVADIAHLLIVIATV